MHHDTLCFIEVRTRTKCELGHPVETITPAKQKKIRRAAEIYIVKNRISPCPMRFDVATIVWKPFEYRYIENAFY
jgi:putative endonuclease